MNEDLEFVRRYRKQGALFDANLLLVYVVGKVGRAQLFQNPHTKQYADDFDLIESLVQSFTKVYTTPNVLTELSNLGKKSGPAFPPQFAQFIQLVEENYCTSQSAASLKEFSRLGLTDAGLIWLAEKFLIVTADLDLYLALRSRNLDAVNFNHLRPYAWAL